MESGNLRSQKAITWLTNDLQLKITVFEPASSDASFRRYFRVVHQYGTHIVMDAPPEKENLRAFIKVADLFSAAGLNVPDILQKNLGQGFLLLQDFGSHCLLDKLNNIDSTLLYKQAMDSLFTLQTNINITECELPQYDFQLLDRELNIFTEWFIQKHLEIPLSAEIRSILKKTGSILIESALEQPLVCVHRDYHSRNLMHLQENSPGIIDFQDAVIGPVTYDLVSLLRDCYISWPETQVETWMSAYFERLKSAGVIICSHTQFRRWFDLMGLQRHLKAIGIFARLNLRDGKSDYLQDIPRTLQYINNISNRYPELSAFSQFIHQHILSNKIFAR